MARSKRTMDSTVNSTVYNKARKEYLAGTGKIYCSWCAYHRSENYKGKWYGGFTKDKIKRPSWKLVSKKRKQWEATGVTIIEEHWRSWRTGEISLLPSYYEVKFKRSHR